MLCTEKKRNMHNTKYTATQHRQNCVVLFSEFSRKKLRTEREKRDTHIVVELCSFCSIHYVRTKQYECCRQQRNSKFFYIYIRNTVRVLTEQMNDNNRTEIEKNCIRRACKNQKISQHNRLSQTCCTFFSIWHIHIFRVCHWYANEWRIIFVLC